MRSRDPRRRGSVRRRAAAVAKGRVAIVGYGNIGRFGLDTMLEAPELERAGGVRRWSGRDKSISDRIPVVTYPMELGRVDAARLCLLTRDGQETAERYLAGGVHTVDSF